MTILFIPGLLCTREVWGKLNTLRESCKVSDVDINNLSSISETANHLIKDIFSENSDDELIIIGISMGGYMAIEAAIQLKNKLKKLILINTQAAPVDPDSLPERHRLIELARRSRFSEVVACSHEKCFYNATPALQDTMHRMAAAFNAASYEKQQTAIINRPSNIEKLSLIEADTLIISSKQDDIISYQQSILLFEKIKKSSLYALSECGHIATLEKENEVFNMVSTFTGSAYKAS